ncbi:MAG: pilus assembly protein TadG-related protein [Nocardioidaceae bacterium]
MTALARAPRWGRDDGGQTTVLIVGLAIVALLMVAVVVDASAAYLRRQGLDSLADGAALAAADGVQGRQVYQGGLGEHARIDPVAARGFAADYLNAMGAANHYPGFSYTVHTDEDRVVVHVTAPLVLPITPPGWVRRPTISGTAASIVAVGG